eukprot:gene33821-43703_t
MDIVDSFCILFGDSAVEGKLLKGNRNAIFFIQNGKKRLIPDFYTFSHMGFNLTSIEKVSDDFLAELPLGDAIKPIPVFRPEDYMYHKNCEDPDRMVNDLGVVANLGSFARYANILKRVQQTRSIDILTLGGSITAGGYFLEFVRLLRTINNLNVTYHNHGHDTIFCVDIEKYSPDLVLIDFSVNDYGHPKLMEALIRKIWIMKSSPLILLTNLWVTADCPVPRYALHSFYYEIPLLNICPAVDLCYGKKHMPQHISDQYSKTDGKLDQIVNEDTSMDTSGGRIVHHDHSFNLAPIGSPHNGSYLPPPLYVSNPIGLCTRCEALADDADARLTPVEKPKGFRMVTRVKIGYGGFNPADKSSATKSFKRSWQADRPGAEISFRFYGNAVKIAMWQRRDSMGIIHAYVDGDKVSETKASGFFKGYTWAMEKNNTGRSEIMPLFEGLEDKEHILTLTVSDEPANVWVKGHMAQIFAILSASDDMNCKHKDLSGSSRGNKPLI